MAKASPATKDAYGTATSSHIPDWAMDAISTAIQQLDTPPWRELMLEHLPKFCETVPRTQDLFNSPDVQARERVLAEVFKGSSRFHEALKFLNIPTPCDYTSLSPPDAIAVRTGYILCFIFRLVDIIYHYGNDAPPPSEHLDIAYMGKKFEGLLFGGPVTLIYMHSELHLATEYINEFTEKPIYAPFTRDVIAALNEPSLTQASVGPPSSSEFICGFLGRHQLRPIDTIVPGQFVRDIEAQVAWEMLLGNYRYRRRWGFARTHSLHSYFTETSEAIIGAKAEEMPAVLTKELKLDEAAQGLGAPNTPCWNSVQHTHRSSRTTNFWTTLDNTIRCISFSARSIDLARLLFEKIMRRYSPFRSGVFGFGLLCRLLESKLHDVNTTATWDLGSSTST
ncbi:hypothetical protein HD806DRAFT_539350 [Xylariaceae sp. AK1471]|nr:hypothetical protein HD806DRAFT_539350 [Xylariaceae sp. AK1471]